MKLHVFLGEKKLEIPSELVNLVKGEQNQPAFLARNPLGGVPVLELDDGTYLSESLAIIEYLEELHPEPPMIGRTPLARARIRELERIIDLGVLMRLAKIVHNSNSPLPGVKGIPEVAENELARLPKLLHLLDERIGDNPFVAGTEPSIADCTLFAGLRFGEFGKIEIDPSCRNLQRWYAAFGERPSTKFP
jgi:glutathione S-transferase